MADYKNGDTASWDSEQVRRSQNSSSARRSQSGSSGRRTQDSQPPAHRRRRKKRHFNVLTYILFVLVTSAILAGVGWLLINDLCAFNKEDITATIEVTADDTIGTIADKLHDAGLIEYKWFFRLFATVADAKDKIGTGTYELSTEMDYRALIVGMHNSSGNLNSDTVRVTIPEGYSVQETIQLLADSDVSNVEDLTEAAKNHVFDYTFVDNENLGSITRLEGFLFPDTYEFFHKEDAVSALDRLLSNFQTRVSGDLLTDIENSQYSLREIVTLASIIEKEAIGDDEERANISSVFYNRLSGDNSEIGTALQSDATIYYALHIAGMDDTQFSTDLDSPYNTYKYGGLPAGPICNPSLSSIKAAVHPNDTGYYYFAYGKDGVSHFFRTYDEHLAFVNSDMYAPD